MFIKLKNEPQSKVGLRVTLEGNDLELKRCKWDYIYKGDSILVNSDDIDTTKIYDLGLVSNLKNDNNEWKIQIWNITDQEIEVIVELTWSGAVEGQPKWIDGSRVIKVKPNERKLIQGGVKFL